jgi:hypothetical protein
MSDRDQRQYQLMRKFIQDFENDDLSLGYLISNLQGLFLAVDSIDVKTAEDLQSEWWTLEQVYAVALDRQQSVVSPEGQALVLEALENIKVLLQQLITPTVES